MTDPARGPTTEELRARALAHETAKPLPIVDRARAEVSRYAPPADHDCAVEGCEAVRDYAGPRPEGRTFYDPARPPLDSEGAERRP